MLLPGGMFLGNVQRGEIVIVGFDVRPLGDGKSHLGKNRDDLFDGARQRMQPCFCLGTRRQADIDRLGGKPRIQRGAGQGGLTGLDGGRYAVLHLVQRLAGDLALFRVHAAELAHHQRDAAFLAKRVDAHGFKGVGGVGGLDRAQDFR